MYDDDGDLPTTNDDAAGLPWNENPSDENGKGARRRRVERRDGMLILLELRVCVKVT